MVGIADVGRRPALVSIYMRNGNLMEYITSHPGCDKNKAILQIAEALNFLHTRMNLVHGDIKSSNVLVSDFGDALLTDFGLSTLIEKSHLATRTMTNIRNMNTLPFAAPELLTGSDNPWTTPRSKTCASDVYAFGMLVVEVVAEASPWQGFNENTIILRVCHGQPPPRPVRGSIVSISHAAWELCLDCWRTDPFVRPSMKNVLDGLRDIHVEPVINSFENVEAVAYMPSGNIVTGSWSGALRIWDSRTGRVLMGSRENHTSRILCVAASPNGRQLASSSADLTIRLWDAANGLPIAKPIILWDAAHCIAYSPDGSFFASGEGTHVYLRDASTGVELGRTSSGHSLRVNDVAFSPDGALIASASDDGTIRVRYTASGEPLVTLYEPLDKPVHSLAFSPDGTRLAAGSTFQSVRIWNVSSRSIVMMHDEVGSNGRAVGPVAFSSGNCVAALGAGTVRVWDASTGQIIGQQPGAKATTRASVAFSPDARSLVSCAAGGRFLTWDLFA